MDRVDSMLVLGEPYVQVMFLNMKFDLMKSHVTINYLVSILFLGTFGFEIHENWPNYEYKNP